MANDLNPKIFITKMVEREPWTRKWKGTPQKSPFNSYPNDIPKVFLNCQSIKFLSFLVSKQSPRMSMAISWIMFHQIALTMMQAAFATNCPVEPSLRLMWALPRRQGEKWESRNSEFEGFVVGTLSEGCWERRDWEFIGNLVYLGVIYNKWHVAFRTVVQVSLWFW